MAHLWNLDDAGEWTATPVGDALTEDGLILRRAATPEAVPPEAALPETWALVCPPQSELRVNGEPVPLGLAILADRDELRVPGRPARYFSTETLARIEAFPDAAGRGFCPRCKQVIESGSAAVRCPGCGLWHHSTDELPCWTYGPSCAGCSHETAADAGFRWTPEDL